MLTVTARETITRLHMGRTVFGRPLYTVSAYLVDGLLIDSGPPATASELLRRLRNARVERIVHTHYHEDHTGGDALLQRALGLPVLAPAGALPMLARFPAIQLYRRIVWSTPRAVKAEALSEFVVTPRHRFEVVPTPGHSADHVCLFEREQGWLFSGDLFIHERARYAGPDEHVAGTLDSLRRVLALRPRLLVCAHAGFVDDACGALERKIAFLEKLIAQARVLRNEGLGEDEISRRLLGPEGLMTRFSRGHFAKINLIRAALAAADATA
jgi:ribonuclease/clavin/mitogillin